MLIPVHKVYQSGAAIRILFNTLKPKYIAPYEADGQEHPYRYPGANSVAMFDDTAVYLLETVEKIEELAQ